MSRSASVLAEGGSTFEESLGMLTAMIEVTQDASTSGNAAKILSLRLRGMKGELEELGEEVDENVESISKMQTQVLNLTHGKVNIFYDNGSFKSTYEIMKGIAKVYDHLSDTEQASLLETIAGKHRSNQVAALIQNWEQVEKATVAAQNAQGTAYEENAIYMDSLKGKLDTLSASWQAFANDFLNSSFVKGVVDTLRLLLDGLDGLVQTFGAFHVAIGALGLVAVIKNFGKLSKAITDAGSAMKALQALWGAKNILGFLSAPQLAAIVAGLIAVVEIIGVVSREAEELKEKVQDAKAAGDKFSENTKTIDEYRQRIVELRKELQNENLSEDESYAKKAELLEIQNELNEAYGTATTKVSALSDAYEEQLQAMELDQANRFLNENVEAIKKATSEMEQLRTYKVLGDIFTSDGLEREFLGEVEKIARDFENLDFTNAGKFFNITYTGNADEAEEDLNNFLNKVRELEGKYGSTNAYSKMFNETSESINEARSILLEYEDVYRNALQAQMTVDSTNPFEGWDTTKIHESLQDVDSFSELYVKYAEAIAEYNDALASGDVTRIKEAKTELEAVQGAIKEIDLGNYKVLFDEVAATIDQTSASLFDFSEAVSGTLAKDVENLFNMGDGELSYNIALLASGSDKASDSLEAVVDKAVELGVVSGKSSEEIRYVLDVLYDLSDVEFTSTTKSLEELSAIYHTLYDETKDYATAMTESAEATGLSSESIALLEKRFSGLDGFDRAKLFEKTAHGIHLNEEYLGDLVDKYEELNINDFNKKINELGQEYNYLANELATLTAGSAEYEAVLSEMQGIKNEIEQVSTLKSQYEGLTSAYNKWQEAKSGSQDRSMYEEAYSGYGDTKKALELNWVGDDSVEAYLDMMLSASKRTGDAQKDFEQLTKKIDGTNHSIMDYFTVTKDGEVDALGLYKFLDDVNKKFGDTYASIDEQGRYSFDLTGEKLKQVADEFGMSAELVQIMVRAMSDAGFEITFDDGLGELTQLSEATQLTEQQLESLAVTASSAVDTIEELGLAGDFKFNIESRDIDDVNKQIKKASGILEKFKKEGEDGEVVIDFTEEGAKETAALLSGLIRQKQALEKESVVVLNVEANSADQKVNELISCLQTLYSHYEDRELNASLNADTTGAETKIQEVAQQIANIKPDVKAKLGLDSEQFNSAINGILSTDFETDVGAHLEPNDVNTVISTIKGIDADLLVTCGIDTSKVDQYQGAEHNSNGTVTWNNDTSAVDSYARKKKYSTGEVEWYNDTSRVKKHFTASGTVKWSGTAGATGTANSNNAFNSGTAYAHGNAFKSGSWGTSDSGIALGGELGEELIELL